VKKYLYLAAAVAAVATPQAAYASLPTDNVWFDLGVFVAHIDSDLRLDNETLGLEGTRIDFENDLGLDNSRIMPKATAAARFLKRFRAQADWFQLNRSGNLMLNGQLVIDDTVFPIHAEVDSQFKTNVYRLSLGYSLVRNDNAEFGIAAGAHVAHAKFSVEGKGPLGIGLEEHRSKSAPLPNVGVFGSAKLTGPLWFQAHAEAFKMKYGNYTGQLFDGEAALEYRFHHNFGVGLGYRYTNYKVSGRSHSWHGVLRYDYYGPVAYVELAF